MSYDALISQLAVRGQAETFLLSHGVNMAAVSDPKSLFAMLDLGLNAVKFHGSVEAAASAFAKYSSEHCASCGCKSQHLPRCTKCLAADTPDVVPGIITCARCKKESNIYNNLIAYCEKCIPMAPRSPCVTCRKSTLHYIPSRNLKCRRCFLL